MQHKLLVKMVVVFVLVLLMLIPLGWVSELISERSYFREVAATGIAQSWTGAQSVTGPVWVVPYRTRSTKQIWDERQKQYIRKEQIHHRKLILLPDTVEIDADLDSDLRYRGLYTVPVYTTQLKVRGSFTNRRLVEFARNKPQVEWGRSFLAMAVSDIRGVATRPILNWQGRSIEFESGSGVDDIQGGMHAPIVPLELHREQHFEFAYSFDLRGMESLSFSPVGKTNRVALTSDWLHPSFDGLLLPQQRTIDKSGFQALWQASSFSSNINQHAQQCAQGKCQDLLNNRFGVRMVQPVDIYHLSERSVKYGILFVGLTFLSFLMFEALKQHRVHPVQYLFVGAALSIFFLLLISLSEHIGFSLSYAIATLACTSLLTIYLCAVFRQRRYGLIFGAIIGVVYGLLFVIIRSEDAALLMGSVLIFAVLGFLMLLTRNIDWYQYDLRNSEAPAAEQDVLAAETK